MIHVHADELQYKAEKGTMFLVEEIFRNAVTVLQFLFFFGGGDFSPRIEQICLKQTE